MGSGNCAAGVFPRFSASYSQAHNPGKGHHCPLTSASFSVRRDRCHVGKGCYRESGGQFPRVLLHFLHSRKERRRLPPHSKPATSEQAHLLSQVSDGDVDVRPRKCISRGLDGQFRSKRRVLPCTHSSQSSSVFKVRFRERDLPVQSSSFRTFVRAQGVHQDLGTSGGAYSSPGDSLHPVLGRLSYHRKIQKRPRYACARGRSFVGASGIHNKPKEVAYGSVSRPHLLRNASENRSRLGPACSRASRCLDRMSVPVSTSSVCQRQTLPAPARFDGGLFAHGSDGPASYEACPNVSHSALEPSLPVSRLLGVSDEAASASPQAVARPSLPSGRGFAAGSRSVVDRDHRCLQTRLGWSLSGPQGPGSVVQKTTSSSYQFVGNASRSAGFSVFPVSVNRQVRVVKDRQYFSSELCQQGRRDSIPEPLFTCSPASALVSRPSGVSYSHTPGGREELFGRLPVPALCVSDGVGVGSCGRSEVVPSLDTSHYGSLCQRTQSSDSRLLQLASRSASVSVGRYDHVVEGAVRVRLPSAGPYPESSVEGQERSIRAHSSGAQLAQSRLVSSFTRCSGRPSSAHSNDPSVADTATRDSVTFQSSRLVPGSMEDKRQYLVAQGLSPEVAYTIISARAPGTYRAYESGWRGFAAWCRGKGFDPFDTSVAQILDYLHYCVFQLLLSPSTVRGRVYAIALYHRQFPLERLSRHEWVKAFMAGARRLCPYQKNILPVWNLQWVLSALQLEPFEPIDFRNLQWLSWKVAFLLAITTAKRVGELQALSSSPRFCISSAEGIKLILNPAFVPKVNSDANRQKETFLVPFCPRGSGSDSELHKICPCRAINCYRQATRHFRKTDQFFVCYSGPRKGEAASKMTIARWIRVCIQKAYISLGKPLPTGLKAHQTRSVAASWAQFNGTSMLDICNTATWSDQCTFARHYQLNLAGHSASARFANNVLQTVRDSAAQ